MMFRKLYWVSESVDLASGRSHVTGVFTSVPHLLKGGLKEPVSNASLRLSLMKLDCCQDCSLGCWTSPAFEGMGADLQQFVQTDEISEEQRIGLVSALGALYMAKV